MFHGSAVAGKVGALVFLGEKGVGKSTLAARLSSQGYEVLCDDAVAILPPRTCSKALLVAPGIPRPRLLSVDASRTDGSEKWEIIVPSRREPAGLGVLFILKVGDALGAGELTGPRKLREILCHGMNLPGLEQPSVIFERSLNLLRGARAFEITRPREGDSLEAVVALVKGLAASY